MNRVHNFTAGPCTLPTEVLEEVAAEMADFEGTGMGIVETSHRTPIYDAVHSNALDRVRSISGAPDNFEIAFIPGGATMMFSLIPLNLLGGGGRGGYLGTGAWANRALADARRCGAEVYSVWDADGPTAIPPAEFHLEKDTRYLHITPNETIDGVRMVRFPKVEVPLVADVSSEYLARPIDWNRMGLVYGGVQKNLAPAGIALVFVRTDLLEGERLLGSATNLSWYTANRALGNTPPMFQIYLMGKMLRWIEDRGGVAGLEKASTEKAGMIYDVIDASGFYSSPVPAEIRSLTNVVFRLPTEDLEKQFVAEAETAGMVGLKGHRSVGGIRASLYAGLPVESAATLAQWMRDFEQEHSSTG
ncbi:MAG: 3-phosphoserine/phosphohydroxythreonine transaminase [Acidimicrobiia bacterium]|nr:3-phosphoserine/phosphohydroxythreonine transaminase [Acidimicrobiia bacterium]